MRFQQFSFCGALLLFSAAPVFDSRADDFTISTPVVVQNGGNVIDGNDTLTILPGGGITVNGVDAISATGTNNSFDIGGSVVTNGGGSFGLFGFDSNTVTITTTGRVETFGPGSVAVGLRDGNRIVHNGVIVTSGAFADAFLVRNDNQIIINGLVSTTGLSAWGVNAFNSNTVTINGGISTTGVVSDGVNLLNDNTVLINAGGSIMTRGAGADAVFGNDRNSVTNWGDLTVYGLGSEGIVLDDFSTATNRATIRTFGDEGDAIDLDDFGTALNTGLIETFGVNADGIDFDDDGNGTNTGRIIVHGPANAGGFHSSAFDGDARNTFTNSGYLLSVLGNSIDFSGGGNTLNLADPSFLGGRILLGAGTSVNISTGHSFSVLWDFSTGTLTGGMPTITGSAPFFWNDTTKQFATIDPTLFSVAPDILAHLTGSISGVLRRRLAQGGYGYPQPSGYAPLAFHQSLRSGSSTALEAQAGRIGEAQHRFWVDTFGGYGRYDATAISNQTRQAHYGALAGVDAMVLPNLTLGFMAGYVGGQQWLKRGAWDIRSGEADTNGIVAGIYGRHYVGHVHVDFAVTGGWQHHDTTRFVNNNLAFLGVDHAGANNNSLFLSPEVTVSKDIAMMNGWALTPSATGRYAAQWIGGYSETGATANARVSDRYVQIAEGRLELALAHTSGLGKLIGRAGVLGRTNFGSGDADITLIGSTVSITGGRNNTRLAGFVGGDAEFKIGDYWDVTFSGEAQFGRRDSAVYSGRFGARMRF